MKILLIVVSLVITAHTKGTHSSNIERNLQVVSCPMGQYISFDRTSCVNPCDRGYISVQGNACVGNCGQGNFLSLARDRCVGACGAEQFISRSGTQCVGNCGHGSYISAAERRCAGSCNQGQLVVPSNNQCVVNCSRGSYISADSRFCINSCQSQGQFISAASRSRCVQRCSAESVLSQDLSSCLRRCLYTQFTENNRCYDQCPNNGVGNPVTRECEPPGSSCPDSFYYIVAQRRCDKCHSSCRTCSGPNKNQCLDCHQGSSLDQATNTCFSFFCQDGSFLQGNSCQPCNDICKTCSAQASCTSCHNDFNVQGDGSCVTCPENKYMTDLGCQDCPVAYPLDPLLSEQDQESILANCQIPMTQEQVQTQISNLFLGSYRKLSNLAQDTTSKHRTEISLSFITLGLALLSKFEDSTEFYYAHQDVSMATKPIAAGVFQMSVARASAFTPNVSKVQLPSTISSQFPNAKVVAMQYKQSVYGIPSIGGSKPPVLSVEIWKFAKKQSVQSLSQPIVLEIYIQTTQRLKGVVYDPSISQWISTGVETVQQFMSDGKTSKIQIKTRHLSSFSVVIDDAAEEEYMKGIYIALGTAAALIVIIMVIALILDRLKKPTFYPHTRLWARDYSFKLVYNFSLRYNLPGANLFSYQDNTIPAYVKGLWLSVMYMIIICISMFVFMTTLVNGSVIATSFTLIPFLALLLIPNSLFIKIVRFKVFKPKKQAQFDTVFQRQTIHTELSKSSKTNQNKVIEEYKQRKAGTILFIVVTCIILALGFVGVYFMSRKIVADLNQNRFIGVLGTFFGSVIIGYVYGVLKLLAGTYVSINKEKSGKCLQILFLDVLTDEAVQHFGQRAKQVVDQGRAPDSCSRLRKPETIQQLQKAGKQAKSKSGKSGKKKKKKLHQD